ncbi:MAG: M56 family metallopeptidase, partial [Bdellovibrio sp.]
MSLAQSLSAYFTLNILIILGFLITWTSFWVFSKFKIEISYGTKLQISYWAILIAIVIAVFQPILPKNNFFVPTAKVWSAESVKSFYTQYSAPTDSGYLSFAVAGQPVLLKSQAVVSTLTLASLIFLLCGGYLLLKDIAFLFRIKRSSHLFKKIGRVSVLLNDRVQIPFSYFACGANVILPSDMLERITDLKIAVSHELQHHRQRDTLWVYILWLLKVVCVVNPFMHFWIREIYEIQEFACDEALIGRKKVDSQSYARCLLKVAQTALDQKRKLVCATGLTLLVERNILKRRIEKMFNKPNDTKKSVKIALGFIVGIAMSMTAYASTNLVKDRRVSMQEAQELAEKAKEHSSFPIVLNDLVLQELNRYLGTPGGREFMRKSLVRMETYRPLIIKKIQEYHMPEELMAVPIVESGYQNLPQSENKSWGAGLWMFIESTARNYGLRVDSVVDERLNPEILTDAAMRYISAN